MVTRLSGIRFFELGEQWRNAWILGNYINDIAKTAFQNPQIISRAIWLARIPDEVKCKIKSYPDIFTRQILLDTFAAKRRQCEKDGFKVLKEEVERLITHGASSKPKLKKTNKPTKKKLPKSKLLLKESLNSNPIYNIEEALSAELKIKKVLKTHCRIAFDINSGGEIRLFFKNKDELYKIIETISQGIN
jgi:hypothetical protein